MRIIMPTFERIEWMPPTITLINELVAMGHEVVYITIFPDTYFSGRSGIKNVYLNEKEISLQNIIPYIKGISGALFRIDNCIKKLICKRLRSVLKQEYQTGDLLWVVNEMTVMLAGSKFLRDFSYIFTVYELHELKFYARNIKRTAKHAKKVVVPEYNRAHIMQSRYGLKSTPIVLPNKSPIPNSIDSSSNQIRSAIEKLEAAKQNGKTIILYIGGLGPERPLEPFLKAISQSENYVLAIEGTENFYLKNLIKMYPNHILYLGRFKTPEHLIPAKKADIGLLNYVSINPTQGLNALFCAPNKIYEYTGLGLPVIANDIPGLRMDVSINKIGELVDYNDEDNVMASIKRIEKHYREYSENAVRFYNGVDIRKIIEEIIQQ